jgi:hypothetical protein
MLSCGVSAPTAAVSTYADYLKAINQITCEATLRCCGTLCSDAKDATFYTTAARTQDYIAAGLLAFNSQAAQDCVTGAGQRYSMCDATIASQPPPMACSNVLTPKSPAGGQCETGIPACVPNTLCQNGVCVAEGVAGQACVGGNPAACGSGLFCDTTKALCAPIVMEGGVCASGFGCVTGTYCHPMPPGMPTCVAYSQQGQACAAGMPCDPTASLVCMAGTCQALPVPLTFRDQLCGLK